VFNGTFSTNRLTFHAMGNRKVSSLKKLSVGGMPVIVIYTELDANHLHSSSVSVSGITELIFTGQMPYSCQTNSVSALNASVNEQQNEK